MTNRRLYPQWYDPHYYGLNKMRENILYLADKYLRKLGSDVKLLDYGCGSSPYKEIYTQYINNYQCADIAENSERDFTIDLNTSAILFDIKTSANHSSTQVLEHVLSPEVYLREAHRICKNNGLLILSTHGIFPYHPDPNDYWRWTKSGLQKVLEDNNWEVIEIVNIIGYVGAAVSLLQYSISQRLPKFLRTFFHIFMQRCIWFADVFMSNKHLDDNSVIYMAVARKKNNA